MKINPNAPTRSIVNWTEIDIKNTDYQLQPAEEQSIYINPWHKHDSQNSEDDAYIIDERLKYAIKNVPKGRPAPDAMRIGVNDYQTLWNSLNAEFNDSQKEALQDFNPKQAVNSLNRLLSTGADYGQLEKVLALYDLSGDVVQDLTLADSFSEQEQAYFAHKLQSIQKRDFTSLADKENALQSLSDELGLFINNLLAENGINEKRADQLAERISSHFFKNTTYDKSFTDSLAGAVNFLFFKENFNGELTNPLSAEAHFVIKLLNQPTDLRTNWQQGSSNSKAYYDR